MTDRELDALVVEKVMGWHRGRNLPSSWSDPPGWFDAEAFVRPAESKDYGILTPGTDERE